MIAFIYGSDTKLPSTSATNYAPISQHGSGNTWSATESAVYQPIPHDLTLDQLRIRSVNAPTTGKSYAFTVMKNGVATALTCTLSGSNTTASDLTDSVSFSAGDTISLQSVPSGTPASLGAVHWSIRQQAPGKFAAFTGTGNGQPAGTFYCLPNSAQGNGIAAESSLQVPSPLAGTLQNLYVVLDASPGTSKTWTFNLRVNASTGPTVAISGANTSGNDTSNTSAVSAGDLVSVQGVPTNSPNNIRAGIGYSVVPTTDGQSWMMLGWNTSPSSAVTNYNYPNGRAAWSSAEDVQDSQYPAPAMTLQAMYVADSTAPGSGAHYTFTVNQGGSATALTVTVSNTNTSGNITGQSVTVNAGDLLDISHSQTGSNASFDRVGLLVFVQTPASGSGNLLMLGVG